MPSWFSLIWSLLWRFEAQNWRKIVNSSMKIGLLLKDWISAILTL